MQIPRLRPMIPPAFIKTHQYSSTVDGKQAPAWGVPRIGIGDLIKSRSLTRMISTTHESHFEELLQL